MRRSTNGLGSTHFSIENVVQKTNQAPSDSDSTSRNSVDFVGNSPPLSRVQFPIDGESRDCAEMEEGKTEDEGSSQWETFSDFASDITRAAKNVLLSTRTCFKKVVAVIVYWETATGLDRLRDQADNLGTIFKNRFNYEVLVYKLPEDVTNRHFIIKISNELDKILDNRDSLFILYYGGHASIDYSNVRSWKKKRSRPGHQRFCGRQRKRHFSRTVRFVVNFSSSIAVTLKG